MSGRSHTGSNPAPDPRAGGILQSAPGGDGSGRLGVQPSAEFSVESLAVRPCLEVRAFPARPAAVAEVRAWARDVSTGCRIAPGVRDVATLLLSEIATNAVLHAHGEDLTVRLATDGELEAAVHDQDVHHQPRPAHPSLDDVHGRGLALVEMLASAWGTAHDPAGKWVWFRLPT